MLPSVGDKANPPIDAMLKGSGGREYMCFTCVSSRLSDQHLTRCSSSAVSSLAMTDEWSVDLSVLPRFPCGFAEAYYASKTQSQRHQERSYKFATESYVCLPTMKTKRCNR